LQIENIQKAYECFSKVEELNPNDTGAWFGLMNIFFKKQDTDKTIKYCDKLINAKQHVEEAVRKKSMILSFEGALQKLKKVEVECYKQKPHVDTIRQICQMYINAGDKQKALYYCDMLIKTTNYITDFGNKALVMSHFGDYDGAVALLKNILQERPHLDSLWYVLSTIHEQHDDINDALQAVTKCHEILMKTTASDKQNLADVESRIHVLKNRLKNK